MKAGFSADRCDSFISADDQLHEVPISPVAECGDVASTPEQLDQSKDSAQRGAQSPAYRIDSANMPAEYRSFFSTRPGTIQSAISRCSDVLLPSDGQLQNVWLLTLIHHWDAETERIVLLTEYSLLIVKYDFIRLHAIHVRRVPLSLPDVITIGDLAYPDYSLTPRLSGFACGVASVLRGCMMDGVMSTLSQLRLAATSREDTSASAPVSSSNDGAAASSAISANPYRRAFQPRYRRVAGVEVSWGLVDKVNKWNPLARDLPTITMCSHPLYWCEQGFNECDRVLFNVETFSAELARLIGLQVSGRRPAASSPRAGCIVQHKDIVIQNYVGVLSVLFNTAQMGFFKERGHVSF